MYFRRNLHPNPKSTRNKSTKSNAHTSKRQSNNYQGRGRRSTRSYRNNNSNNRSQGYQSRGRGYQAQRSGYNNNYNRNEYNKNPSQRSSNSNQSYSKKTNNSQKNSNKSSANKSASRGKGKANRGKVKGKKQRLYTLQESEEKIRRLKKNAANITSKIDMHMNNVNQLNSKSNSSSTYIASHGTSTNDTPNIEDEIESKDDEEKNEKISTPIKSIDDTKMDAYESDSMIDDEKNPSNDAPNDNFVDYVCDKMDLYTKLVAKAKSLLDKAKELIESEHAGWRHIKLICDSFGDEIDLKKLMKLKDVIKSWTEGCASQILYCSE